MEEPVERIEDCDGKQSDCLIQRVCDLVSKMHQVLAKKILQNNGAQSRTDYWVLADYWKATMSAKALLMAFRSGTE